MRIEIVDNHSVAVDLLTGGPVLDAGARGFVFSKWFADRGHQVFAMDPSPDIETVPNGVALFRTALVGYGNLSLMSLQMHGDPGAWYVKCDGDFDSIPVPTMNIDSLKVDGNWDLIKLNIEGSEYDVLDTWPGPIARQIVVSFHEHTPRARGRAECDRLIAKISQWYDVQNVVWEKRYGCSENYWDLLFTLKGLS